MTTSKYVSHWMTKNPITVFSGTSLPHAHALLRQHKIRRLPVVNDGRLVGIITQGDIRNAEPSDMSDLAQWEIDQFMEAISVGEVMTTTPITVYGNTGIGEAAAIMLKQKVGGLPVIDDFSKLIGIITDSDIFKVVIDMWPADQPDYSS